MFPEITRDDVFRLETQRLWLRWPDAADAEAVTAMAMRAEVAEMTTRIPHPYPKGEAARRIDHWRGENAAGEGLTLALTGRGGDRRPFGLISIDRTLEGGAALGFILVPERAGRGLATEAAQALTDTFFILTRLPALEASARVVNPANRRVLEKCGFAYDGTVLQPAPARGGMISCDRFRLPRKTWASLKLWRQPRLEPRAIPDDDAPGRLGLEREG